MVLRPKLKPRWNVHIAKWDSRILYAIWLLISLDGQKHLVILQRALKNPDPCISCIPPLVKPSLPQWPTMSIICCR